MKNKFSPAQIMENVGPFLLAGVALALFFSVFILLFHVFIWGVLIGGILWIAAVIKHYLFPSKVTQKEPFKKNQHRIIEHDDKK